MRGTGTLEYDIDALEQTNARMRAVFEAKSGNWKLELVKLRRIQGVQLSILSESLGKWAGQVLDPGDRETATRLFAEMRRSVGTTQAEWPLSLINDAESLRRYNAASQHAIAASTAFFSWIRTHLRRPEQGIELR